MALPLYDKLYALAGYICHQDPGRSYFWGDFQFPLCARCTGMYLMLIVAATLTLFGKKRPTALLPSYSGVVAALALNGLTVFAADGGSNHIRLVLGMVLGGALGLLLGRSIKLMLHKGG
jgi:uncharacterized membrane protein